MGTKNLAISLFGGMQVSLDGQKVTGFESSRVRALLAYLVVEHSRSHSRHELAGLLWPEQDESTAHQRLSQALYNLRQVFGEAGGTGDLSGSGERYLLVTPQEVQFNPHLPCWLDVHIFTELIQSCTDHPHPRPESCPECAQRMAEAVRLVGGDFLAGFSLRDAAGFEEWSLVWRERLHLQTNKALNHLVQFHTSREELTQALDYARQHVALDPLDDPGNRQLMRLLAMSGEHTAAMVAYANFRRRLKQELGVVPERQTQALHERLHLEADSGVSLGNLPEMLSPLVGRRNELAELTALLLDPTCRLISLLGPGGSGKTRLALEVGHALRYQFTHGVYLVPLSALSSTNALTSAIAEALGLVFRGTLPRKTQLQDYLRSKGLLLILDSFETVLPAGQQVVDLLQAAPGVKALVTTRARLNVTDEQVFPLGGMDYRETTDPDQALQSSAVQLFLAGARRSRPDFILDAGNTASVGRICRLVSGMPLGLLLASTWVSDHSEHEIVEQISRSLDFLSVEWADLPERQRSLRATFEYSWNLLSAGEPQLMMKLALFRDAFTSQAAFQVAGARVHELHALVGKSMLGSTPDGHFQMHDLVRQYSAEKLSQAPGAQESTARQQYGEYFLQRTAGWSKDFKGAQQSEMLSQADKEIDDVQAAWEWAAGEARLERLSLALEGLLLYLDLRYRYPEGEHACQLALERLAGAPAMGERLGVEGWLLAWQAHYSRLLGKVELARQLANKSLERLGQAEAVGQHTQSARALLWRERGYLAGSLSEQIDCFRRSATLYQALDEPWWKAGVLAFMVEINNRLGKRDLSLKLQQEALELSRAAGEPHRLGATLMYLAYDQLIFGAWETGARLMEEAADCYRAVGDLGSLGEADLHLSTSLGWMGRFAEACELMERALEKLRQVGDRYHIAYGTLALGLAQRECGWYSQALATLQEVLEASQQDGYPREEAACLIMIGCLALVQGEHSQAVAVLEQSVASLRKMGFAGELGMALGGAALAQHVLQAEGDQARNLLQEALRLSVETHSRFTLYTLPAALVVLLADSGMWEWAVEAYSALMTDPIVANSRWFADMVGNRMDLASAQLSEDIRQAAEERGRQGDLFTVLGKLSQDISAWRQTVVG